MALAAALTAGAAVLFGLIPLFRSGPEGGSAALREDARGSTASAGRHRLRQLLGSRDFLAARPCAGAADADEVVRVVVVSERVRELLLEVDDPLGRQISNGLIRSDEEGTWTHVVGVVGDARYVSLTREPTGVVYLPMRLPPSSAYMARSVDHELRTSVTPTALVPAVRALDELDAGLPFSAVRTMEDVELEARGWRSRWPASSSDWQRPGS